MGAHFDWNVYRGEPSKPFQKTALNVIYASNHGYTIVSSLGVGVLHEAV